MSLSLRFGNSTYMSRIGKKILTIPEKTEVKVANSTVTVKGPLGELTRTFRPSVDIVVEGKTITFTPKSSNPETAILWGTYASHVENMIEGVNKGYEKRLIIEGIGFKADVKGSELVMALGFSHPVHLTIPKGVKVTNDKAILVVNGIDKELVGQFAANIRAQKKPEPYKGKGIRYENEVIRRKQGKKTA